MATPDERRKQYFTAIAPQYDHLTGHATQSIFAAFLEKHGSELGLGSDSVIHDNAAGPGTATGALIPWLQANSISPKQITVTDYVPGMLTAFEGIKARHLGAPGAAEAWRATESNVADALDLSAFPDGHFTHHIDNCSLSTFGTTAQQAQSLRETFRALAPGGFATFLTFRRFPPVELIAAAQREVLGPERAAARVVPMNGPEFLEEGYLARMLVAEAGFAEDRVRTSLVTALVRQGTEDWEGLVKFMQGGPPAMMAKRGIDEDELKRWPEAIHKVMKEEVEAHGGVYFEAWAVVGRK